MKNRWLTVLVGGLAGAAMIAAACAPADDDSNGETGVSQQAAQEGQAEGGTASDVLSVQQAGQQEPEDKSGDMMDAVETSVSGIPLDPNALYGGVLQIRDDGEGPSFSNWEEAAGISFNVIAPIASALIHNRYWGDLDDFRNNAFLELHGDLAESWEQSADGLQWTLKLRDNVMWNDGTPFTCDDAQWSFNTIRTGEGLNRSPRAVQFLAVDNFTCADDVTLIANLNRPKPGIIDAIGMPYHAVYPAHRFRDNTEAMRNKRPEVGTGPFNLVQWIPGEKYVFERKDDYWDQPFPYLDGIQLSILSNQAADAAVRAGRLHTQGVFGWSGPRAETMLRECDVCTFWERAAASSTSPALFLDKTRAPWNLQSVNDAVSLAIDRANYIEVVQQGWFLLPTGGGFYPVGQWAMPEERVKAITGYNFDDPAGNKEQARQILADAGFAPGELKPVYRIWSVVQQDLPPIIEDLKAVGFDPQIEILETARAYQAWSDGDFDIGHHSFWQAGIDPDVILYEHFYTGSDRNYNRYSNPEYDRLVDLQSATVDPEERKVIAWDAMEVALRDQAKIIISHSTYLPGHHEDMRGWMPGINYLSYGMHNRYETTYLVSD